ncbi:MAG: hypothetical protein NTX50_05725 [Candidatus Sumerlaeota bacterium]|nr:hypothetical protein [Candidatus Sumerlaeota bacterium]
MPRGRGLVLALVIVLMIPSAARACGMCAWASLWSVFPAIIAWTIISAFWLIAQFALDWKFGAQHPSKLKIWLLALLIPVSVMVSGAMLGPLATIWMFVPPALTLSRIISNKSRGSLRYKRLSVGLGVLAVLAFCVTLFTEGNRAGAMTKADIIEMWQGTALERQMFTQLKMAEPASIEEHRNILRKKPFGTIYGQVALRIAAIGDPIQDSQLLLGAMEKLDAVPDNNTPVYMKGYYRDDLEKALAQLSKIDLPHGTDTKTWKAKISQSLGK